MSFDILKQAPIVDKRVKRRYDIVLQYLKRRNTSAGNILDIGPKNEFTDILKNNYPYADIYNTKGDLDNCFQIDKCNTPVISFDIIVYSHVLEHQMNPLTTLKTLRDYMNENSAIYVVLPDRPKFLWTKNHFHEVDDYRFRLLAAAALLEVTDFYRFKIWRYPFTYYLKGFRPLMRLFFEYNRVYELKEMLIDD